MLKPVLLFFSLLLCSWDDVSAAPYNPGWGSVGVFTDAQTCAGCHRATPIGEVPSVMRFPDAQGEDISPPYQWRHSMMANAFNDRYYQAVIEDEATLFSGLAGLVEDTCLTCHSPMAHTNAHQTGTDLSQDASCTLPDGCYRLTTASAQNHAREGVSCTLCHQIEDDNLGSPASFSGGFSIAAAGDADAFTIYGPYLNPHAGGASLMQSNTGYTPQFGNQMTSSAHCASCHTLFTPTLDADDDTPTGRQFLEQGAFLEWQNSVYANGASEEQQCQDCHMRTVEQAIEYMVETEGLDEATATSEIERYVVWPAQALGYKLGQLKILALRERAQEAFGDDFDIRDFNQQVLDVASTPLPFIEATVISWILSTSG